ncbi:MAG: EamA family transporter [Armatimonadota bacterium]
MPVYAVLLVILSAAAHIYWNWQVKRSPDPGAYAWWLQLLGSLIFAPVGVLTTWPPHVPHAGWLCVAGTGMLYGLYYMLIAASYEREDLSSAYPIARGVAPAATVAAGVLIFHERLTPFGWAGALMICAGVLAISVSSVDTRSRTLRWTGIAAAVGTGLVCAGYSAVDKRGVQLVQPALYISLTFAAGAFFQGCALILCGGRRRLAKEAARAGVGVLPSALLNAGGYVLVLTVLRTQPVAYVVPLRSVSVLLSVLVGSTLLGEGRGWARFPAAVLIATGITAIAFGG